MSNRAGCKRRIVVLATAACQSVDLGVAGRSSELVPVAYSDPPETANQTAVYFANLKPTDGRLDPAGMRRTSPRMDDSFVLNGTIDAFGFADDESAEEAAERILNAIRGVLDACQSLVDPSHAIPDGDPSEYRCQRAYVGAWEMNPYAPIGDTHVARISFAIEFLTANA